MNFSAPVSLEPLDVPDDFRLSFKQIFSEFSIDAFFSYFEIQTNQQKHNLLIVDNLYGKIQFKSGNHNYTPIEFWNFLLSHFSANQQETLAADIRHCRSNQVALRELFLQELFFLSNQLTFSFFKKHVPISGVRFKSSGIYFFILQFTFSLLETERTYEAFFEQHKKEVRLVNCFLEERPIHPNFFVCFEKEVSALYQKERTCPYAFDEPPWVSKEIIHSAFCHYLLSCYYATPEFKLRKMFDPTFLPKGEN